MHFTDVLSLRAYSVDNSKKIRSQLGNYLKYQYLFMCLFHIGIIQQYWNGVGISLSVLCIIANHVLHECHKYSIVAQWIMRSSHGVSRVFTPSHSKFVCKYHNYSILYRNCIYTGKYQAFIISTYQRISELLMLISCSSTYRKNCNYELLTDIYLLVVYLSKIHYYTAYTYYLINTQQISSLPADEVQGVITQPIFPFNFF